MSVNRNARILAVTVLPAARALTSTPRASTAAAPGLVLPTMEALRATLTWSNSQASHEVLVRAALLRPTFERLLALALEPLPALGLAQLKREWRRLARECPEEALRAAPSVERILRNIAGGFRQTRRQHFAQARRGKASS